MTDFLDEMSRLSAAEEFFEFLEVPYDEHVVRVNRLHILKRMHDILDSVDLDGLNEAGLRDVYTQALARAHDDFTKSDAVTEKVFKVFQQRQAQGGGTFVDLSTLGRGPVAGATKVS